MKQLTIGICSYNNLEKLRGAINSIRNMTTGGYDLVVIDNNSSDLGVIEYLKQQTDIRTIFNKENRRYAGAVNQIFEIAETEYVSYMDNDIELLTKGWDEILIKYLGGFHEIFSIAPASVGGAYPIDRGRYVEVTWSIGCCFMCRKVMFDQIKMDSSILHQNECDISLRARMEGYKVALAREVSIIHHCSSTVSPECQKDIAEGVMQFINKWNRYFGGKDFHYFSPNVMRWDDFPINRAYLAEYFKELKLNDNVQQINYKGQTWDLIKIPMYPNLYRTFY